MGGKLQKKTDNLHGCIFSHPQVVNFPLKNDHVNTKDHTTGELIEIFIYIAIRELHNQLIKTPSEGGFSGAISESGDVIIVDTLLRKCMPLQI